MNNFKVIYRILRYLEKAMDHDQADMDFITAEKFGLTKQRWVAIMDMLEAEGYITRITINLSLDGEVVGSISNVRITLKGLEYLQENSLMQKAADIAKGVADIIS